MLQVDRAVDRRAWGILEMFLRNTRDRGKKEKRSNKERAQSLWKLTPLWKSSRAGFPQRLGKACGFFHSSHKATNSDVFQEGRSTLSTLIFCPKNGEPLRHHRSVTEEPVG